MRSVGPLKSSSRCGRPSIPAKSLGADVAKNLELPLQGISQQYEAMELPIPDVEVAMRSGDSTPEQRRRIVSHPPDILVTTPESLFLLLTSIQCNA